MSRFENWEQPWLDEYGFANDSYFTQKPYGWRCQNKDGLKLGKYTDIGFGTYLNAKFGIEIGDGTQIGSNVSIYSINTENDTNGPVKIGKDCLIGSFSLILPNSIIPDGSKIKAYSIVTVDNWGKTIVLEVERKKKFL